MYQSKFCKYNAKIKNMFGGVTDLEYKQMAIDFETKNKNIEKEIEYIYNSIEKEKQNIESLDKTIKENKSLNLQRTEFLKKCDELKKNLEIKKQDLLNIKNHYEILHKTKIELEQQQEKQKQQHQKGGINTEEKRFLKLLEENTNLVLKKRNVNKYLNDILDKKMEKTLELERINKINKDIEPMIRLCNSYHEKLNSVNSEIQSYNNKIKNT